jgi:hypothetical protein
LHELARRVRKLRRKIYRELPVATSNRITDLDGRMSYGEIASRVQKGQFGVDAAGAALALCRACMDRGLNSWCYEFGFPQILTHTVTIVEVDGALRVHDPFFNLGYPVNLNELLESLRNGNPVTARRSARDRKIYLLDPGGEPEQTVRWLEANADCELDPQGWFRRFELAWSPEAFCSTFSSIRAVHGALAERGYPSDLQFLMLHPLRIFDGQHDYRDPRSMPLVGGRDLQSPVASLRVAERKLAAERAGSVEKAATLERLEAELARANSQVVQLATERDEMLRASAAERDGWLQQKVTLQAGRSALEGELAKTRSQLSAAIDLRAQRDSQIAQLRAEIEDTTQEFELHKSKIAESEAERREWDSARLRLEIENRDLQLRLEAGSRQSQNLGEKAAQLEGRAETAEQQVIEATHYFGSLIEEIDRMRGELDRVTAERDAERRKPEVWIALFRGSRLRALWDGIAERCAPLLRGGPARR